MSDWGDCDEVGDSQQGIHPVRQLREVDLLESNFRGISVRGNDADETENSCVDATTLPNHNPQDIESLEKLREFLKEIPNILKRSGYLETYYVIKYLTQVYVKYVNNDLNQYKRNMGQKVVVATKKRKAPQVPHQTFTDNLTNLEQTATTQLIPYYNLLETDQVKSMFTFDSSHFERFIDQHCLNNAAEDEVVPIENVLSKDINSSVGVSFSLNDDHNDDGIQNSSSRLSQIIQHDDLSQTNGKNQNMQEKCRARGRNKEQNIWESVVKETNATLANSRRNKNVSTSFEPNLNNNNDTEAQSQGQHQEQGPGQAQERLMEPRLNLNNPSYLDELLKDTPILSKKGSRLPVKLMLPCAWIEYVSENKIKKRFNFSPMDLYAERLPFEELPPNITLFNTNNSWMSTADHARSVSSINLARDQHQNSALSVENWQIAFNDQINDDISDLVQRAQNSITGSGRGHDQCQGDDGSFSGLANNLQLKPNSVNRNLSSTDNSGTRPQDSIETPTITITPPPSHSMIGGLSGIFKTPAIPRSIENFRLRKQISGALQSISETEEYFRRSIIRRTFQRTDITSTPYGVRHPDIINRPIAGNDMAPPPPLMPDAETEFAIPRNQIRSLRTESGLGGMTIMEEGDLRSLRNNLSVIDSGVGVTTTTTTMLNSQMANIATKSQSAAAAELTTISAVQTICNPEAFMPATSLPYPQTALAPASAPDPGTGPTDFLCDPNASMTVVNGGMAAEDSNGLVQLVSNVGDNALKIGEPGRDRTDWLAVLRERSLNPLYNLLSNYHEKRKGRKRKIQKKTTGGDPQAKRPRTAIEKNNESAANTVNGQESSSNALTSILLRPFCSQDDQNNKEQQEVNLNDLCPATIESAVVPNLPQNINESHLPMDAEAGGDAVDIRCTSLIESPPPLSLPLPPLQSPIPTEIPPQESIISNTTTTLYQQNFPELPPSGGPIFKSDLLAKNVPLVQTILENINVLDNFYLKYKLKCFQDARESALLQKTEFRPDIALLESTYKFDPNLIINAPEEHLQIKLRILEEIIKNRLLIIHKVDYIKTRLQAAIAFSFCLELSALGIVSISPEGGVISVMPNSIP